MTWAALTTPERVAKVRKLASDGLTRSDQATRLGLRLSALSQFCAANGIVAANENTTGEWAEIDSDQRSARILELADDGLSMRNIAFELGTTIGKLRVHCTKHGLGQLFERRVRSGPPMVPEQPVPEATWAVLAGQPVDLMGLEPGMCRWPINVAGSSKQMFCGCQVGRESYCATHAAVGRTVEAGMLDV